MPIGHHSRKIYEFAVVARDTPFVANLLQELLINVCIPLTEITFHQEDGRIAVGTYFSALRMAERLRRKIQAAQLKGIKVKIRTLLRTHWRDAWKRDFKPFRFTKSIDVVPAWQRKKYRVKRQKVILIDTATAFGTGLHETTRFMAELIERSGGRFGKFLDIGTGTGILSFVAAHHGARELWAIDIDPLCVPVARANAKLNGVRFKYLEAVGLNDFRSSQPFDYVAANLISQELIKHKRHLIRLVAKGQFLALSGISLDNLGKVRRAFAGSSLRCLRICRGKQWAALLYARNR